MKILYLGNKEDWNKIEINYENNTEINDGNLYFYSENKPSIEGKYWYYNQDGKVIFW